LIRLFIGAPQIPAHCRASVQFVPNFGSEEFGYLQHIVSNYGSLADLTFFLQADTPDEVGLTDLLLSSPLTGCIR
jgi:hypothetical protein